MAVGYDAQSESHNGTTGNTSSPSFTWDHAGGASARGALVFVFSAQNATNPVTSVTYGGTAMTAVPYTATDTDTEPGSVKAYYLDNCGTGTKAVVVNRTNNTTIMYAVCFTVTAAGGTEVYLPGVHTQSGSGADTTAASSSNTGVSSAFSWFYLTDGTDRISDSMRFVGVYSGANAVTAASINTTAGPSIDFGQRVIATYRQTTAAQGAIQLNWGPYSDDLAAIGLCVREKPPITGSLTASAIIRTTVSNQIYSLALPTLIGSATNTKEWYGGTTSVTIDTPTGTANGDVMIAFISGDPQTTEREIDPPAGWTFISSIHPTFGVGDSGQNFIFAKVASSEGSTQTFGWGSPDTGYEGALAGGIATFRNAAFPPVAFPVAVNAADSSMSTGTFGPVPPNSIVGATFTGGGGSLTTWTPDAALTELMDIWVTWLGHTVDYGESPTGGTTVGPYVATYSSTFSTSGHGWFLRGLPGGISADAVIESAGQTTVTGSLTAGAIQRRTVVASTPPSYEYDSQATLYSGWSIGASAATERLAQAVVFSSSGMLDTVSAWLMRSNSPTDNVIVELAADSGGLPGSIVGTIANFAASSVSNATQDKKTWNPSISVSPGTYWIVMRRSGSTDSSNNILWYASESSSYTAGQSATYSAGWQLNASNLDFSFETRVSTPTEGGTIDAVLQAVQANVVNGSLTANAVLKKTTTGTPAANAVKRRTQTGSITANAITRRTSTGSLTADAIKRRTPTGSLTANAVKSRTQTGTFTSNAIRRLTIAGSISANSIKRRTETGSLAASAIIKKSSTFGASADAILSRTITGKTFTAEAWFTSIESIEGSLAANAVIKASSGTKTFAASAVTRKTVTTTFTASAILRKTQSATFTAAAAIKGTASSSLTTDAVIKQTQSGSLTANAVLRVLRSGSLSANALVRVTRSGSLTASAVKFRTTTGSHTAAAVIARPASGSLSASAIIRRTGTSSATAGAVIAKAASGSFSAAALISRVGRCVWTTPGSTIQIAPDATLSFLMPTAAASNMHFEIQLDIVATFDGANLRIIKSHTSLAGWEFWDGGAWQPVPQSGVPNTYCGNEARYAVQTPIANGTWYRRVRAGVI